jgi:hypothetical protein
MFQWPWRKNVSEKKVYTARSITRKERSAIPERTEDDEYLSLCNRVLVRSKNTLLRNILDKYNEINSGNLTDKEIGNKLVKELNIKKNDKKKIQNDIDNKIREIEDYEIKSTEYNKIFARQRLLIDLKKIYNILCNKLSYFGCGEEYIINDTVNTDIDPDVDEEKEPKSISDSVVTSPKDQPNSLPKNMVTKYDEFLETIPKEKSQINSYKKFCIHELDKTSNPNEIRKYQSLLQVFTIYDTTDSDLRGGRKSKKYVKSTKKTRKNIRK